MAQLTPEERIDILRHNYQLVRYNYRMGRSQYQIVARNVQTFKEENTLNNQKEKQKTFFSPEISSPEHISFKDAVFLLKKNLENEKENSNLSKVLQLEIKIHIFESLDSLLACPKKLYEDFIKYTASVYEVLKSDDSDLCKQEIIEYVEDEFNLKNKKEEPHAVKMVLLASLCGITGHYRQYDDSDYKKALVRLKTIHNFIDNDLPNLFSQSKPSLGLLGLSLYLLGQLERTQNNIEKSEAHFLAGMEAYTERIIQYENLLLYKENKTETDLIEYEEKKTVSLRRSMLIVSLGLSYNYLITGQLTKGLFSIRLARATLRKVNSGIYNEYSDLLYFALTRAKYSNVQTRIDEVIEGLQKCKNNFEKIAKSGTYVKEIDPSNQMHYKERANIELALAYRYKAEFITDKIQKSNIFQTAIRCLEEAIDFSKETTLDNSSRRFININIYIEAMYIASHIYRIKAENESDAKIAGHDIQNSVKYANLSEKLAREYKLEQLHPESLLAKAAVCIFKAKASDPNGIRSTEHFKEALKLLKEVLNISRENKRVKAVSYLRLSELFSLNPKYNVEASFYFSLWEENLSSEVEHAFCHLFSKKHERKISDTFLINNPENLELNKWEDDLKVFLAYQAVKKLAKKHIEYNRVISNEKSIRGNIIKTIEKELKFTNLKEEVINNLVGKYRLLTELEVQY